jgi:tetratricopeptide (TPR) repeat protein
MADTLESSVHKVNDAGVLIQESLEKLTQAFQMERDKTREQAEQESSSIINNAREEAGEIIARARQEALAESDKLIAKYKEEGEQILRESRAKASIQARQESDRIITESVEKTKQIIKEVIEQDLTQTKTEFVQFASEARSKLESEKSKLLSVTKSIEQIINETETNIQTGFEHLDTAITEIQKKLQTENEIADKENVVNTQQVAEEAEKNDSIEKPEKQEIEHIVLEEAMAKAEEARKQTAIEGARVEDKKARKQEAEEDARLQKIRAVSEELRVKAEEVSKQATREADIWIQKGKDLAKSGKHVAALRAFQEAIELVPKNVVAWRGKGTALGCIGRNDEALEAYDRALEINTNDIDTWHNKAVILDRLGRKAEAKEAKESEKRAREEAKLVGHS